MSKINKRKIIRILKKIATTVLCVVMFFSLGAGIICGVVSKSTKNTSAFSVRVVDDEYVEVLYNSVYDSLKQKMALVVIEPEDLTGIITRDLLKSESVYAMQPLIDNTFGGKSEYYSFESEALREHIEALLGTYSSKNGVEYEEGSAELVYEMICDTVTAELRLVPTGYVSKISPVLGRVRSLSSYWYVPVAVYALCVAGELLLSRRHIKNGVYNVMLSSYLSSFAVFGASLILYHKDYLRKTIFGNEVFQYFARQVYLLVIGDLYKLALVFSVSFLVIGISVSVAIALERRHRRTHTDPGENTATDVHE